MIHIIESRKVEEVLELVLEADDRKLDCQESTINASEALEKIQSGMLTY